MLNLFASVKIALRALRVNKLRSALTMLGIIIGVGAVITKVAVARAHPAHPGADCQHREQRHHRAVGQHHQLRFAAGQRKRSDLDRGRRQAIAADCPAVAAAAPSSRGAAQVIYGNNNWATSVLGPRRTI